MTPHPPKKGKTVMKRNQLIRLLAASLLLLTLLLTAVACNKGNPPDEGTTPPDTLDTVAPENTTDEPIVTPDPTVSAVKFPVVSVCLLAPLHCLRTLARPVSYYALFQGMAASEPTSWLSAQTHIISHL